MYYIIVIFLVLISLLIAVIAHLTGGASVSRGKRGEAVVAEILKSLPEEEYAVYNDVYLNVDNRSVQIDHVVVSRYSLFAIETKYYHGDIYGKEISESWTQVLNYQKYTFRNPVKQNISHVIALKNVLGVPQANIIPLVVFMRSAILNIDCHDKVIIANQLLDRIGEYKKNVYTTEHVEEIKQTLRQKIITDEERATKHVQSVRNKIDERNALIRQHICPKCGGELIHRHGKFGSFLGCSNYPKCKFTVKL